MLNFELEKSEFVYTQEINSRELPRIHFGETRLRRAFAELPRYGCHFMNAFFAKETNSETTKEQCRAQHKTEQQKRFVPKHRGNSLVRVHLGVMHRIGLPEVPGLVFLTADTCCSSHGPLPIQDYELAFCGSWTVTAMRLSPDARGQSDAGQSGSAQVPCFHQE